MQKSEPYTLHMETFTVSKAKYWKYVFRMYIYGVCLCLHRSSLKCSSRPYTCASPTSPSSTPLPSAVRARTSARPPVRGSRCSAAPPAPLQSSPASGRFDLLRLRPRQRAAVASSLPGMKTRTRRAAAYGRSDRPRSQKRAVTGAGGCSARTRPPLSDYSASASS